MFRAVFKNREHLFFVQSAIFGIKRRDLVDTVSNSADAVRLKTAPPVLLFGRRCL